MTAVTITQITPHELEVLINNSVINALSKQIPPQPQPVANDLLTLEQACNKIGLAKQTVYGLVSAGKVPHMKRNKRLYFSNAELIEWIKSGKRITTDEANQIVNNYLTSKSN